MPLSLTLHTEPTVPLEVEGILPETVAELTLEQISELEIFHGNRKLKVADYFELSGDPSDGEIDWNGDMSGVHWIGAKMTSGCIRVLGNAGRHVGSEMRGGQILVDGDSGDWIGGEMHGGQIIVKGNAGHQVGAAYRGSARGMTGGTILVHGRAGNELGHTMRRGLIAVGGDCGDLAGFNMLAGTILVFGNAGIRHGAGMRRGTIGFFGAEKPPILPSFRHACRYSPDAFQLVFRQLQQLEFPVPASLLQAEFDLYNGDLIDGGRGEILLSV